MTALLRTTAVAAGLLALGAGTVGTAQAAGIQPPPLGKATAAMANADIHLVGGRHWRGAPHHGGRWHRNYRHRDNSGAIALGAAGAIIGLSALAAANAQAYPAPTPYGYGAPVYAPGSYGYSYDDEVGYPEEAYPPTAGYPVENDYATGNLDAYAPPPPPVPAQSNPPRRNFASSQTQTSLAPEAWSQDWYNYCASKYRSFNAQTGYFTAYSGEQKFCR